MDPSIFIIILNFNRKVDLLETLESFKTQDYSKKEIVVVDNGSDETLEDLTTLIPEIHVIKNNENLGWAGGNNIGIKYAIDNDADFILLANNDLYFKNPTIIRELITTLKEESDIRIIGPIQNYYFNKELIYTDGWNFLGRKGRIYNKHRATESSSLYKRGFKYTDSVSGAFMVFSSSLIREIGYIDEKYFLYGEDADFAIRTWHSGHKCAVRTDLIIYHKISATAGESPMKLYYKTRNLPYMIIKNKNDFRPVMFFFIGIIYSNIKMILKILFYSKYRDRRIDFMRAFFTGWIHFLVNKMGKVY